MLRSRSRPPSPSSACAGASGPPAVLDQPGLAQLLDRFPVNHRGGSVAPAHARRPGFVQCARQFRDRSLAWYRGQHDPPLGHPRVRVHAECSQRRIAPRQGSRLGDRLPQACRRGAARVLIAESAPCSLAAGRIARPQRERGRRRGKQQQAPAAPALCAGDPRPPRGTPRARASRRRRATVRTA